MDWNDEGVRRRIKPFVVGWVGEMIQRVLDEGLSARGLSLGAERPAGCGDLRMSGSIKASTPIAARVNRGGPTAVNNDAWTCLSFDQARFSLPPTLEPWSAVSPSCLVAPVGGLYLVHAMAHFMANPTGLRAVQLRRNAAGSAAAGIQEARAICPAVNTGSETDVQLTCLACLSAGDTLEMFARQTSGGTLDVTPEFMLARIA